jgi:hypothetical protein
MASVYLVPRMGSVLPSTYTAEEDMSQAAGLAVKLTADGNVGISDAATDDIVGICEQAMSSATDSSVSVMGVGGMIKARYGDSVNEGDMLTSESGGRLVSTTTEGDCVCAIAREAGSDGEWHWVNVVYFIYSTDTHAG